MKKIILSLALLLFAAQFSVAIAQTKFEMNGAIVPRRLEIKNKSLELNGLGIRSKLWLDIYVQALYLSTVSEDAQAILDGDIEMAMRIEITSALVSSGKLTRNMDEGFKNSLGDDLPKFRPRIDELKKLLDEKIVAKDVFVFFYSPLDQSLWIYKNDVFKGKIAGLDFKKAFFGIWLSKIPVDEQLKNDLLGKYK